MRFPAQKYDGLPAQYGAVRLGQHADLGRLHQLKLFQTKRAIADHPRYQGIAITAGLDAVDLPLQVLLKPRDVGKVPQPLVVQVLRHRQRIPGTHQIGWLQHLDLPGLDEGLGHRHHMRDPVTQEDVELPVLEPGERDRQRGHGHHRLVAQALQHHGCQAGGSSHVAPAHIGKTHGAATRVFCRCNRQPEACQGQPCSRQFPLHS